MRRKDRSIGRPAAADLVVQAAPLPRQRAAFFGARACRRSPRGAAATLVALLIGTVLAACEPPPAPLTILPDDALTVADTSQLTGRRMNLPLPDCTARPSDCDEIRLINQLDGWDLDPRVEVRFSGPVDVGRVTADTLYLEQLGASGRIGLNRLVWDAATNTLYGQPRQLLRDGTRYRVVVTAGINGQSGTREFTTTSATRALRQMRSQLDNGRAYTAAGIALGARGLDFVRPDGTRTVYPSTTVARVRRFNDVGNAGLQEEIVFDSAQVTLTASTYAFGSFLAPSWLDADRTIPAQPTGTGPVVRGREEVGFTLILPQGLEPAGGWPVAIFGPGVTRSKYDLFLASDELLRRGIATIAIDPVGHAYGPRSTAGVDLAVPPSSVTFSGFGRGIDQDRDGVIGPREGLSAPVAPHPKAAIALRDGLRQTALDNMALARAIARGVDVDGDGSNDLRTTGIGYYAQSLGGIYGTMVMATDPTLGVGVLNVPGGPILDIARLAPGFRPEVARELANRRPALLNGGDAGFTESQPLYDMPPETSPAPGALAIQAVGARTNWVDRSGSPEAFAPLLRTRPAEGLAAKKVLYQFAFGDGTVPNPTSATIMRAGGLQDVTTFYRNDLTATALTDPHGFLLDPRVQGRQQGQLQVAAFLASGGTSIVDPDGPAPVFEVPITDPAALERCNFSGSAGLERCTP